MNLTEKAGLVTVLKAVLLGTCNMDSKVRKIYPKGGHKGLDSVRHYTSITTLSPIPCTSARNDGNFVLHLKGSAEYRAQRAGTPPKVKTGGEFL